MALSIVLGLALCGCAGKPNEKASADRSERLLEQSRLILDDFLDDTQYQNMRV
jgi:hypothetical protein